MRRRSWTLLEANRRAEGSRSRVTNRCFGRGKCSVLTLPNVKALLLVDSTFPRKNAPEHSRLSQRVFGAEVLEHGDRRRQEQAPARVPPRALSWPHKHAHAPAPRSPASRAPADTPAAPRSPRSQHLRLGGASATRLSIRQRLTPLSPPPFATAAAQVHAAEHQPQKESELQPQAS